MGYIATNWTVILAATVASLLVGALYSALAQRPVSGVAARFSIGLVAVAFVAEFWLACILAGALILAPANAAPPWVMAIGSAVVIWVGFVLPTLLVSDVFRRLSTAAVVGDVLHWLVVMVAQAAVLQTLGLTRPV
jgi:hypothetical protein